MKRLATALVVLSLAGALGIALAGGVGATPNPKSQFIGDWEICDPDDSTSILLSIRGGNGPLHLRATDNSASGCPSDGPAMLIGQGTVDPTDPSLLHTRLEEWCVGYPKLRLEVEGPLPYDVLVEAGGCEWDGGPGGPGIGHCIDLDPSDGYDECSDSP